MTTRILRPNAAAVTAGATVTGAGSTNAALSDSSNSSYVELTAPGSVVACNLGTYTLAAGEVVKSYRVATTAQAQFGANAIFAALSTDANPSDPFSYPSSIGWALPGSGGFASSSYPVTNGPLTQAQIDALSIVLANPVTNASGWVRASETWAELVVASPPVVSNTGPTVAQTTATPTLTAAYTWGVDGEAQSKIRFKVFTQAQYTAGGFDPETSANLYDSGELATSSTSHKVTTPLPAGTNYRCYVKAAHRINGVDYWSTSWHTLSAWDVTYTATVITSVVPVPDPPSGSVGVLVNRNTGTPAWTKLEVQRSEDGGTTWLPVRGATGKGSSNTFLTWGANSATVNDFESPNGLTSVIWRARATNLSAGVEVVGSWVQSNPSGWSHSSVFLKAPTMPAVNTTVDFFEKAPELAYPIEQGVFPIVGAVAPVVVSDVRQAGVTTLMVETYSYAQSVTLKRLFDSGAVLLLHPPAGAGRLSAIYFVAGAVDEAYASVADEWQMWSVDMQVVARPPDDTP